MNKLFSIISIFIFTFQASLFTANAQAPEKMSYQAVVRDASNNLVVNKQIGVQIFITQGTFPPVSVYSETHTSTTNSNGLLTLQLGGGTLVSGNFSNIKWENGSTSVSANYDLSGGTNYTLLSSTQLLSVPYALYAKTAGNATSGTSIPTGTKNGDMLYWNGTSWIVVAPSTDGKVLTLESGVPVWKEQTGVLPALPTVIMTEISRLTKTSAKLGGNVLNEGGTPVTQKGICWGTNATPTIDDNKTIDGTGSGVYTSTINGLTNGTTYYIRAYAINSGGVIYSGVKSFVHVVVSDADGISYDVIPIGTQLWMSENLKTTKYNDGTPIPLVTDNTEWKNLTTPGYCWYENDPTTYGDTYGALYNWYTVNTGKLCPTGWHVPSNAEWTVLTEYLGGANEAGGKLKEAGTTHWDTPNTGATNETGFTALPAGGRSSEAGLFNELAYYGNLWSTSEVNSTDSKVIIFSYQTTTWGLHQANKKKAASVRCLKD